MRTDRRGFLGRLGGALALALGRPSLARALPGSVRIHRATRNTRLGALGVRLPRLSSAPAPFKRYAGAPKLPLPRLGPVAGPSLADCLEKGGSQAPFAGEPLGLAELGRLLYLTNGVTGSLAETEEKVLLRAAPSAGALYAGEVYVVAERVRGLAPGVYYYAVADHALVELAKGSQLSELAAATEVPGELEGAAVAILLTNVFGRYTWRYAARGYRYALIDTGHIGENLRLTAAAAGLVELGFPRFHDDALNLLLGLDGATEAVCALHVVGHPAAGVRGGSVGARLIESGRSPAGSRTAPERYHEATKLVPAAGAGPARSHFPATPPRTLAPRRRSAKAPEAPLERAIRARRSALHFAPSPLSRDAFSLVLEAARGHPPLARAELELHPVVHRVKGLQPGLYRFAASARLELRRAGDWRQALVAACLGQAMAGSAAVGFAVVARLGEAAERGDRSYRELLVGAGALAQRVYLLAAASGLAARNLASFLDDELNALLELDGARQAVVHLTMFGPGR